MNRDPEVYAPEYRRDLHNPVAGSIRVAQSVPLVIVEGNYLLLEAEPWNIARQMIDQVWYVQIDDHIRRERLIKRHIKTGKSPEHARRFVLSCDERNAKLIRTRSTQADALVQMT